VQIRKTETPHSLLLQRRICVPTSCSNEQLQQMTLTLVGTGMEE